LLSNLAITKPCVNATSTESSPERLSGLLRQLTLMNVPGGSRTTANAAGRGAAQLERMFFTCKTLALEADV